MSVVNQLPRVKWDEDEKRGNMSTSGIEEPTAEKRVMTRLMQKYEPLKEGDR
jgi:hypothetical protein